MEKSPANSGQCNSLLPNIMGRRDRTFSSLSLLLLLALIPISLSPLQHQHHDPFSDPEPYNRTLTRNNYIVRFFDYKIGAEHRSYLEDNLRSLANWRWIDRKNPASDFPTDFGVVEIHDSNPKAVIDEIERLKGVRDVHADSSYSRRSLFVEDANASENDGNFFCPKKRPGKVFTPMSFEEEEDGDRSPLVNASINWKRKLMMEVESLFRLDVHCRCGSIITALEHVFKNP